VSVLRARRSPIHANSFPSLNKGADSGLGWKFEPVNGGNPVASGRAPASQVVWGDINGCVLPRVPWEVRMAACIVLLSDT